MSGSGLTRVLPGWLRGYRATWLREDLPAGLVLAVMLIPQSMAYASLAGMPPIAGLYAALVSLPIYALLGTSSHLSFGPFALVSLLTATAVEPLAGGDPTRYVALAGALALLVGALHLLLALVRAAPIADLISRPVVVGFTAAVGLVIALSQIRDLTGADVGRSERFVDGVGAAVLAVQQVHLPTLLTGLAGLAVLVAGRRFAPRVPAALVIVAGGVLASVVFGLEERGVTPVGDIPAGLPVPRLPAVALDDLVALLPSALVLGLICVAGNMSMAKAIAAKSRERLDSRRELLASGGANLASGVVGGFPVAASFTRTVVVHDAGARTQMAGLVAMVSLVATLVLLTPALEPLPRAILAAIVLLAVAGLVDLRAARTILRVDRPDGVVLVVTFAATLLLGAELGLGIGVLANLLAHVGHEMRPPVVELGRVQGTRLYRNVARYPTITDPSGVILRVEGALDFLSAQRVSTHVHRVVGERPQLRWLLLVCSSVNDMDTTGLATLYDLKQQLQDGGVELHLATVRSTQRDLVRRAGLWDELLASNGHPNIPAALRALGFPEEHALLAPAPHEDQPRPLL